MMPTLPKWQPMVQPVTTKWASWKVTDFQCICMGIHTPIYTHKYTDTHRLDRFWYIYKETAMSVSLYVMNIRYMYNVIYCYLEFGISKFNRLIGLVPCWKYIKYKGNINSHNFALCRSVHPPVARRGMHITKSIAFDKSSINHRHYCRKPGQMFLVFFFKFICKVWTYCSTFSYYILVQSPCMQPLPSTEPS